MENKSKEMARLACEALNDHKAVDLKIIDISGVSVVADYFIIASGNNPPHIEALLDAVKENLGRAGYECAHTEGSRNSSWVLLDYRDIIVHIFSKEDRLFYDLERIWRDGEYIDIEDLKKA